MPTVNDFKPAIDARDPVLLRNALVHRVIYAIADTEDPSDLVANTDGIVPLGLAFNGSIFWLDENDTTTPHDGVVTIVTDDGYRYKVSDFVRPKSVLTSGDNDPPDDPDIGDAYILGAAPTGDWAGHGKTIAVFTSRGWVFITPDIGDFIYVESGSGYQHYDENGDWVDGVGQSALSIGSVMARHFNGGGGWVNWIVVNQTTNTPPVSPTDGVAYIVGSAPTGAWAGHTGKIATWEVDHWQIYQAANGWLAYDQSLNQGFRFDGTNWLSQAGAIINIADAFYFGSDNWATANGTAYNLATGNITMPTTGNTYAEDTPTILTYAARRAGAILEFDYSIIRTVGTTPSTQSVGLFRDNESTAIGVMSKPVIAGNVVARFRVTAPDTSPHVYKIRMLGNTTTATDLFTSAGGRWLEIKERA